jgi:hypothetical protein
MSGLKVPLKLPSGGAQSLVVRRGEAFLRSGEENAAEGAIASYMHVISFTSVVPGVSSMVLMVVPAQHGKATQCVNDSLIRVARVMREGGFDVECVCTDGDGTCAALAASSDRGVAESPTRPGASPSAPLPPAWV